jgi:hypothetical protein
MQHGTKSLISAGVPIRKPVRSESMSSWTICVLTSPMPVTVRSSLRVKSLSPAGSGGMMPTGMREPTCRCSCRAARTVATTCVAESGLGARPCRMVSRLVRENIPSGLATSWTCVNSTDASAPRGVRVAAETVSAVDIPVTCGSARSCARKASYRRYASCANSAGVAPGGGCGWEFGWKISAEGLVLAR